MRTCSLGMAALSAIAAGGFPANAAPANAAPQKWQLATANGWCKVSTGDPHTGYLSLQVTPGDQETQLYIVGPTKVIRTSRGDDSKVEVTLTVGSQNFALKGDRFAGRIGGTSVLRLYPLSTAFADALPTATQIRIDGLPRPLAIPIRGAIVATNGLAKCEDDMLRRWGIDAGAFHRLQAPPRLVSSDWIDSALYPNSAIENAKEGGVVVRVDVDSSGRVTDCVTAASSSYEPLDRVTCTQLMSKAKFEPAIGADGQPTAASQTVRVTFTIEDF